MDQQSPNISLKSSSCKGIKKTRRMRAFGSEKWEERVSALQAGQRLAGAGIRSAHGTGQGQGRCRPSLRPWQRAWHRVRRQARAVHQRTGRTWLPAPDRTGLSRCRAIGGGKRGLTQ